MTIAFRFEPEYRRDTISTFARIYERDWVVATVGRTRRTKRSPWVRTLSVMGDRAPQDPALIVAWVAEVANIASTHPWPEECPE